MDNYDYEVTGVKYTCDCEEFKPNNPLNRPKIGYKRALFSVFGFILMMVTVYLLLMKYTPTTISENKFSFSICICVLLGILYIAIISKKAVIWLVKLYQHFAPDAMRLKCAFEPSCSEYMILAVNKYGVVKGVAKGINRLFRCHPPGGIDYP